MAGAPAAPVRQDPPPPPRGRPGPGRRAGSRAQSEPAALRALLPAPRGLPCKGESAAAGAALARDTCCRRYLGQGRVSPGGSMGLWSRLRQPAGSLTPPPAMTCQWRRAPAKDVIHGQAAQRGGNAGAPSHRPTQSSATASTVRPCSVFCPAGPADPEKTIRSRPGAGPAPGVAGTQSAPFPRPACLEADHPGLSPVHRAWGQTVCASARGASPACLWL